MRQTKLTPLRPLLVLFIALTAFFIAGKNMLTRWNINQDVVIAGNLLLVIVTLLSYLFLYKGLQSSNPHAFVRGLYGGFIVKFFVIAIAAFIYIMIAKKDLNKPALIICLFLYLVYTFIEVSTLIRLLKQKKNA